ncbi:MAG: YIP1 family protein [Candidatus Auribacterota bacterium]|nr:YIP1 family protein [Candidatus Auribacterota bacterium]
MIFNCPRCKEKLEAKQTGIFECPYCFGKFRVDAYSQPGTDTSGEPVAWENRKRTGLIKAYFITFSEIVYRPKTFFASLKNESGICPPLFFFVITVSFFSYVVYLVYGMFDYVLLRVFEKPVSEFARFYFRTAGVILTPFTALVSVFIRAVFLHLSVFLFGGRNGFESTLKVVGYSSVSYSANLIPCIGFAVWIFWEISLYICGIKKLHNLSQGRAVWSVLFPVILLITLMFLGCFLFIAYFIL